MTLSNRPHFALWVSHTGKVLANTFLKPKVSVIAIVRNRDHSSLALSPLTSLVFLDFILLQYPIILKVARVVAIEGKKKVRPEKKWSLCFLFSPKEMMFCLFCFSDFLLVSEVLHLLLFHQSFEGNEVTLKARSWELCRVWSWFRGF